jgi:hypothetical protein
LGWEDLQHMNYSHPIPTSIFHWLRSKYGYWRQRECCLAELASATQPCHWCLNIMAYFILHLKHDAMQRDAYFYTYLQTYKLRLLSVKHFQILLHYLLKETAVKPGLNGNLSTGKFLQSQEYILRTNILLYNINCLMQK